MTLERTVSRRFYLSTKAMGNKTGFLSMMGMGVGCFSMIIALSVMNGFENLVHRKLKGFDGDIRIKGEISNFEGKNNIGINSYLKYMERRGVVESENTKHVISIKSVEPLKMKSFYQFKLSGDVPSTGQIIIGQDLAYRLGKNIGDSLLVYSPIDQTIGLGILPRKYLIISGIFSTKILDYDDRYAFISTVDGTKLFKRKSKYDGIDIRVEKGYDINQVKSSLSDIINSRTTIKTWEEQNSSLVNAMRMERLGTIIILSLIFLVAAFNLATSLTLISIQKIKEVSILRAVGASSKSITKIMIKLGMYQAGRGAIVGFFIAVIFILIQNQFSLIPIPSDIYFVSSLPMKIYIKDLVLIVVLSFVFILGSSFIAGRKLANSNLVQGLQWAK